MHAKRTKIKNKRTRGMQVVNKGCWK